jgi:hypothetical protein
MKSTATIQVFGFLLLASCSSPRQTASERCAAINAQFTNGTPMSQLEAKLGPPDTMIITTTLSLPPETQNQRTWVYHFTLDDISTIQCRRFGSRTVSSFSAQSS